MRIRRCGNGVTASCVAWARRRSRGREEHQKRDGPKRRKNERRPEEHRKPAKDADTDKAVDEHEERPYAGQSRSADRVRSNLLLSCRGQQVTQCLSLREDLLKLRLGDSQKRGVLTCANACVATAGMTWQQRLLADVIELLELCQDDFVTVPIDGEDLHRTSYDNVSAVAGFAFPEDECRAGELDDLGDLGKLAELASLELAEQSEVLEELFAFRRNHDSFRLIGSIKGL